MIKVLEIDNIALRVKKNECYVRDRLWRPMGL
jgi:hypothetical protein